MTSWLLKYYSIIFVSAYLLSESLSNGQDKPSQADLDAIAQTISNVQSQIEDTRQQRGSVEIELEANEKAINDTTQSINSIEARINSEQIRLSELQRQSNELEFEKRAQETLISQYILAAYKNGREEYLKLILNQQNVSRSSRALRYYQYFNDARTDKIAEFQETILEISSISVDIQESNMNLSEQRNALIEQQSSLEQKQNERFTLLAELDEALKNSGSELSRLEVQYEEMALLIEELSLSILDLSFGAEGEDFSGLGGSLPGHWKAPC